VPLDEVRQAWANFGAEALSCPALLATSTAFRALCWETSAMGYHRLADQAQQRDRSQEAARWLSQAVQDLDEAVHDWRTVLLWLERLASSGTQEAHTELLERVRALSEQATAQQQRLWHLVGQVRREQRACCDGQVATPVAPPAASDVPAAVTLTAAGTQEEEEE
jgi:hypothetical protein